MRTSMPPVVLTISTLVITGAARFTRIDCTAVVGIPGAQFCNAPLTVMIPAVVPVCIGGSCDKGIVVVFAGTVNVAVLPDGMNRTLGSSTGTTASDTKEAIRHPVSGNEDAGF